MNLSDSQRSLSAAIRELHRRVLLLDGDAQLAKETGNQFEAARLMRETERLAEDLEAASVALVAEAAEAAFR